MKLVILTDNFGLNFSGGAIATCRIMETIQKEFEKVIVIGKQIGLHNFTNFSFLKYQTKQGAIRHIKTMSKEKVVFYGDFYMAYYFILAKVPFYFTYHDNWPEQKQFGWDNWRKSFFYIPIYKWIFRKANWVATVSSFKHEFIKKHTSNTSIIRNGINSKITKKKILPLSVNDPLRILMLGNIDDRKYGWAVDLFRKLAKQGYGNEIEIDIYGNTIDNSLQNILKRFSFVSIKGFTTSVDFANYHLYLCTSKIENLSISVCEALFNHTPVLSFDVGGLAEVIDHPKTGYLTKQGNIDEMLNALKQINEGTIKFNFNHQDLSDFDWKLAGRSYFQIFKN